MRWSRERRAARRSALESRLWQQKEAAARAPEDRVALEFDRARKRIVRIADAADRGAAYGRLAQVLARFTDGLRGDPP